MNSRRKSSASGTKPVRRRSRPCWGRTHEVRGRSRGRDQREQFNNDNMRTFAIYHGKSLRVVTHTGSKRSTTAGISGGSTLIRDIMNPVSRLLCLKVCSACANFLSVCASWTRGASDFPPPRRQDAKGRVVPNLTDLPSRLGAPSTWLRACFARDTPILFRFCWGPSWQRGDNVTPSTRKFPGRDGRSAPA